MHTERHFLPRRGADGWQVSNPPILSMAPLRASLALFDEASMPALRAKSEGLTGYLQFLLDELLGGRIEVITPRDPAQRGCQISFLVHDQPTELVAALDRAGIVCDFRPPNVVRVAPVPLYNTFHDVWRFVRALRELLSPR
jgi:kynureninase